MKHWKVILALSLLAPSLLTACGSEGTEASRIECSISIGIINSETGSQAGVGVESVQGYEMARDEINNARGGVLGCDVKLIYKDDASMASNTASAVKELAEEDVPIIIGAAFSGGTIPATGVANVYRVPFLVPIASSDLVTTQGYEWVFRINAPSKSYASTALDFVRQELGITTTVAIIYDDSQFGESAAVAAATSAIERELEIVAYEPYTAGSGDYTPLLNRVKEVHPDIIYFASRPAESVLLMQQCEELDINPKLYLGHAGGFVMKEFLEASRHAQYVIATAQWAPDVNWPGAARFTQRFIDLYGTTPTMRSAQTYQALYVARAAIEQANEDEPLNWADTREVRRAIRDALRDIVLDETIFGPISFDRTGQNPHQVILVQVIDAAFVTVYPEEYRARAPVVPVPRWAER